MKESSSRSCTKWGFDEDEMPMKCCVRRHRQEKEFLEYVRSGRSCMIVGLPGSGRHMFSTMMQEELKKEGMEVRATTFANLGAGDMAFQRMMGILGFNEGNDLSKLTLEKAKDVFVQKLKNRDKKRDGTLYLFIDSFDSCCRLPDREEFLVQFFDTNEGGMLWRKAGFVPILISTRTPKMIVKYRPGMGSPFERHYQQHCVDMKPLELEEFKDFCGCSKRTIACSDMALLLNQVGPWPGALRMVLSDYNSHCELSMGEVLQSQDVRRQLDNHYSQLSDFFAKFGEGFGLAEGVTLSDCIHALATGKPLPQSKSPISIYELFMEYGLVSKKDDDTPFECNLSERGREFLSKQSIEPIRKRDDGAKECAIIDDPVEWLKQCGQIQRFVVKYDNGRFDITDTMLVRDYKAEKATYRLKENSKLRQIVIVAKLLYKFRSHGGNGRLVLPEEGDLPWSKKMHDKGEYERFWRVETEGVKENGKDKPGRMIREDPNLEEIL